MRKSLITLLTAVIVSSTSMATVTETQQAPLCGLVISETTLGGAEGAKIEQRYPVTVNLGGSTGGSPSSSCAGVGNETFAVTMHNGTIKLFKKRIGKDSGYWYGEDETDGSMLNYLFNPRTGEFITGSLTDMTSGEVVNFRTIALGAEGGSTGEGEHHLLAFVRDSNNFGAD